MKLLETNFKGDDKKLWFYCPGCKRPHPYTVPRWKWNGSFEKPTFHPSLKISFDPNDASCHLWLEDGMIKYCSDSKHEFAGQTIECPDWPVGKEVWDF